MSPHIDEQFEALSSHLRRRLLVSLLDSNPQDGLMRDGDGFVASEPPSRVQTRMVHAHLPKLEELGYIRWNRDTNEVRRGPAFDEIRPILRFLVEQENELVGRSGRR